MEILMTLIALAILTPIAIWVTYRLDAIKQQKLKTDFDTLKSKELNQQTAIDYMFLMNKIIINSTVGKAELLFIQEKLHYLEQTNWHRTKVKEVRNNFDTRVNELSKEL